MSTSQTPPSPGAGPAPETPAAADPSMEDILASIRRILSEDEVPAAAGMALHPPGPAPSEPNPHDILVLDPTMIASEPLAPEPASRPLSAPAAAKPTTASPETLVAPEAAAAAASSVGSLVRRLTVERSMQVRSGGPTIEDIVREELRPLLKEWLDANLPAIVERLVRAEIERVVGRVAP